MSSHKNILNKNHDKSDNKEDNNETKEEAASRRQRAKTLAAGTNVSGNSRLQPKPQMPLVNIHFREF